MTKANNVLLSRVLVGIYKKRENSMCLLLSEATCLVRFPISF